MKILEYIQDAWLECLYKFSEPYRIRTGAGLRVIRSRRELTAVVDFCKEALKDKKHMNLNPDRKELYNATINLDKWGKKVHLRNKLLLDHSHGQSDFYDIMDLIEKFFGWYWV